MCLPSARERAGTALRVWLSPYLIFVPAGAQVWPGGDNSSDGNVIVMRARAGQGQTQLIRLGGGVVVEAGVSPSSFWSFSHKDKDRGENLSRVLTFPGLL